jgi:hypothetical protein
MQKFVNNYEMKIASKDWYIFFCKAIFDVVKVIFTVLGPLGFNILRGHNDAFDQCYVWQCVPTFARYKCIIM